MRSSDSGALPPVGAWVDIRYRRFARPEEVYRQLVLDSGPTAIVTYQPRTNLRSPVRVPADPGPGRTILETHADPGPGRTIRGTQADGGPSRTILEPGSPVIWFTFPGAWHDIGLFHLADGTPTGIYANVLTPVALSRQSGEGGWSWCTTDLCLDVWVGVGNGRHAWEAHEPMLLDEDELNRAETDGAVGAAMAARAREEADALVRDCRAGRWPPPVVREWSLDRLSQSAIGAPIARGYS